MKKRRKAQLTAPEQSPAPGEKKNLKRYHVLVDRKLGSTASEKELAELQGIETELQVREAAQTAGFDQVLEQRHRAISEKLTILTSERRNLSSRAAR